MEVFQIIQESNECREYILKSNLTSIASVVCDQFIPGPFDVLSPDGFSIAPGGYFYSIPEAQSYFETWKKGYEKQGYYSANSGRIELNQLERECTLIRIKY